MDWGERFGQGLVSRDGVVAIGPVADRRLAVLRRVGGVRARPVDASELAERLPLLARWEGPAMFDEDGGVIRTRGAMEALIAALRNSLRFDEIVSVRAATSTAVEVRAGGVTAEHGRVVVCAGRGTAPLARGAGLPLPVRQSVHVRLTYPVRGDAPARLACLQDGSRAFGAVGAYADPLPGNRDYAVGLGDTAIHEDGSLLDPSGLAAAAERTNAYVGRALPGVEPRPIDARHCWVTEVPWSPDGIAAWEADGLLFVAGDNLFKHAPVLGRALARAALGDGLTPTLSPQSKLGADVFRAAGG